jgi:hypothetical protein
VLRSADEIAGGTLTRAAGVLTGLGLVIAAASPFSGVSPRGGSGASAPAQQEVNVVGTGEFTISPVGKVMRATAYPAPGDHAGPTMSVTVSNITNVPLRLSVRLTAVAASLDTAVKVRGSVAGAVVINTTMGRATEWSKPAGVLASGQTSTLRLRFRLLEGLGPDAWLGRLDVRQLEIRGVKLNGAAATNTVTTVIPDPTTPGPTTPSNSGGPPPVRSGTTPPAPPKTSLPEPDGPATAEGRIPEGENPALGGE